MTIKYQAELSRLLNSSNKKKMVNKPAVFRSKATTPSLEGAKGEE